MKDHAFMIQQRPKLGWFYIVASIVLFWTAPAFSHKVTVFAWVENGTVHTESRFGGGRPVMQGNIEVFDPQDRKLLEGTTDDEGRLSFTVPQRSDLKIVLNAGMGHANHWWVRADEINATEQDRVPADRPPAPVPGVAMEPVSSDAADCLDAGTVRQIVLQALETKLAPLEARLADQRPPWRDIAGGIGYILGLMGIAVLMRNRKTKGQD